MGEKVSKSELKKDYWFSEKMINEMLPEPEEYKLKRTWGTAYLWELKDVYKATQTDRYKEHVEKSRKRRAKGRELAAIRKNKNLKVIYDIAKKFKIYKGVPKDRDKLMKRAVDSHNEWEMEKAFERGYDPKTADVKTTDELTLNRWALNFIRHEKSNYDELLEYSDEATAGKVGHAVFYETLKAEIRSKFRGAIEADYPYLLNAFDDWDSGYYKKDSDGDETMNPIYKPGTYKDTKYIDNPKRIEDYFDAEDYEDTENLETDV